MARVYIRLDRSSDNIDADTGDRSRTYVVHNRADDTVIGYVHETWHASAFDADKSGKHAVDMSLYKGSTNVGRRSFTAETVIGGKRKACDVGATRAQTVACVRKNVLGK